MELRNIAGREVAVRKGDGRCLITFFADFDRGALQEMFDSVPDATIAAVGLTDWNAEMSPWDAPPVFGEEGFGHGAQDTLDYITGSLVPEMGCDRYMIGGYSLAGLFSLWACYRTDAFECCAAASPSVWFPGWDPFIRDNRMNAGHVFLSLGDREAKTRNQVMRTVADRIQLQYDVLKGSGTDTVLEWNPGNHFQDVVTRKARAFGWILSR